MDILAIFFIIGVVILIVEMITLSYYLFFIGVSLILSVILGLFFEYFNININLTLFFIIFSFVSLFLYYSFRNNKYLKKIFYNNKKNEFDDMFIDIGNYANIVSIDNIFNGSSKCFYKDTYWQSLIKNKEKLLELDFNLDENVIDNLNIRCKIIGNVGNILIVEIV